MALPNYADRLTLLNARPDAEARIAVVSLPVHHDSQGLTALGDLPTQAHPVGWWPQSVAERQMELTVFQDSLAAVDTTAWNTVHQVNYRLVSSALARVDWELNINADLAAGKVAGAVKAEKLVMVSDTHGVRTVADDPKSLARHLSEEHLQELLKNGVITSGMQPKVQACIDALDAGVGKAHIIDGRLDHSLLLEIYTDEGVGTQILK